MPICHSSNYNLSFLIYDSRSGSTLLASFLNAHPQLFVSLEAEYILSAMAYVRSHGKSPKNNALRDMLLADRRLAEWDFNVISLYDEMATENSAVTLPAFTSKLLEKAAGLCGKHHTPPKYLIFKQGLLTHYLPELNKTWPQVPLIHIYRDGRAVFASKKNAVNVDSNKPMASDPAGAATRWVRIQQMVKNRPEGTPVLNISYEHLLIACDKVLAECWRFFGVSAITTAELNTAEYSRRIPDTQKKIHTLVGKSPDLSRLNAWQRTLSLSEIQKYERIAAKQLKILGYDPMLSSPKRFISLFFQRTKHWIMKHPAP